MSQKRVLGHEGLGSARLEEFAQAARQMKQNEQPVLHNANLQSVARLHKPADLGIRHSQVVRKKARPILRTMPACSLAKRNSAW